MANGTLPLRRRDPTQPDPGDSLQDHPDPARPEGFHHNSNSTTRETLICTWCHGIHGPPQGSNTFILVSYYMYVKSWMPKTGDVPYPEKGGVPAGSRKGYTLHHTYLLQCSGVSLKAKSSRCHEFYPGRIRVRYTSVDVCIHVYASYWI